MMESQKLWCHCHKPEGNRFMIACDRCDHWFHGSCVNISKSKANQLNKWYCRDCVGNSSQHAERQHREKLAEIQEENSVLLLKVKSLQDAILKAEENKNSLLKEVCNLQNMYHSSLDVSITQLKEKKEYVSGQCNQHSSLTLVLSKACQTESATQNKQCQTELMTSAKSCQTEHVTPAKSCQTDRKKSVSHSPTNVFVNSHKDSIKVNLKKHAPKRKLLSLKKKTLSKEDDEDVASLSEDEFQPRKSQNLRN